jgi:urease accessory protein
MTIVELVYRESRVPDRCRGFSRDTVTLGWEDRTHVHGRRRSDGGVEFGTSLPRGTVLHGGDCFVLDTEQLVVEVIEQPEPVFIIEPQAGPDWALFAYHIGNRHQPLMVTDHGLVCVDVPGVEQLLRQHSIPFVRATRPFTPVATLAGHHEPAGHHH